MGYGLSKTKWRIYARLLRRAAGPAAPRASCRALTSQCAKTPRLMNPDRNSTRSLLAPALLQLLLAGACRSGSDDSTRGPCADAGTSGTSADAAVEAGAPAAVAAFF